MRGDFDGPSDGVCDMSGGGGGNDGGGGGDDGGGGASPENTWWYEGHCPFSCGDYDGLGCPRCAVWDGCGWCYDDLSCRPDRDNCFNWHVDTCADDFFAVAYTVMSPETPSRWSESTLIAFYGIGFFVVTICGISCLIYIIKSV